MKKFISFMKTNKKLSEEQIKNISYINCKNNLNEFVKSEIQNKQIISENNNNIIKEAELLTTAIGLTICFLIVVGTSYWVWRKIDNYIGITPEGTANKHIAQLEAQHNMKKAQNQHNKKMEELNLQELINLLKGCTALK